VILRHIFKESAETFSIGEGKENRYIASLSIPYRYIVHFGCFPEINPTNNTPCITTRKGFGKFGYKPGE
jgi:hypothetical protein